MTKEVKIVFAYFIVLATIIWLPLLADCTGCTL